MISVPLYSTESFMANKDTKNDVFRWIIGMLVAALLLFVSVIWNAYTDNIKRVETALSAINISQKTQGESLVRLEERTKSLERVVYESKAVASGFKEPQIITASLATNVKFESRTSVQKETYFIQ